MKFKKSDFEQKFPTNWLTEAKELAISKADWQILENGDKLAANFYISKQKYYHIILHQTRKFILDTHCSCAEFQKAKGCIHIPALMYYINPPADGLFRIKERTKFTFEQTLELLSIEEIYDFLRFYVPNNAQFNRHFRQFFEYKFLSDPDLFSDYLDQFTSKLITNTGKKNKTAITDIENIFQIHLFRAQRQFEAAEYVESFNILNGLMVNALLLEEKIHFSIFSDDFFVKTHQLLATFFKLDLAPVFVRKISNLYLKLVKLDQYQYFGKNNAIDFLSQHPNFILPKDLKRILLSKILNPQVKEKGPWIFFAYNISADVIEKDYLTLDLELNEHNNLASTIAFALSQKSIPDRLIESVTHVCKKLYKEIISHHELRALLNTFMISIQHLICYLQLLEAQIDQVNIKDRDIIYNLNLDAAIQNPGWKESIFDFIIGQNDPTLESLLLRLYLNVGDYEGLWRRIIETDNISGLNTYHQVLHQEGVSILDVELTGLVDRFLQFRAGEIVNDQLEKLLKELLFSGFPERMKLIKEHIKSTHSDRVILLARLNSY